MSEIQRKNDVPQNNNTQDFGTMVDKALSNKKLNKQERMEILNVLDKINSAKEKIKNETIAKLESFLNGAKGGSDFEKVKKIILEKIAINKAIKQQTESSKPSTEQPKQPNEQPKPQTEQPPLDRIEVNTQTPIITVDTESQEKPVKQEELIKQEKQVDSQQGQSDKNFFTDSIDKIRNFFTGKVDISKLPKQDQAIIKDLQESGFKLKPIEGQKGAYSVDMNGLFDKSTLIIKSPTQLDFKTDIVKINGRDIEYSFENTTQAKEKMTKINKLFNIEIELKNIPELSGHRDIQQEIRYQELTKQKSDLMSQI